MHIDYGSLVFRLEPRAARTAANHTICYDDAPPFVGTDMVQFRVERDITLGVSALIIGSALSPVEPAPSSVLSPTEHAAQTLCATLISASGRGRLAAFLGELTRAIDPDTALPTELAPRLIVVWDPTRTDFALEPVRNSPATNDNLCLAHIAWSVIAYFVLELLFNKNHQLVATVLDLCRAEMVEEVGRAHPPSPLQLVGAIARAVASGCTSTGASS